MADPATGEIILEANETIDDAALAKLLDAKVTGVLARSPLACEAPRGVCRMCYGISLATMKLANLALQELTEALNRGWGDRDSRVAMLLQEERAGAEVRVAEDVLRQALEEERAEG